jgi:UDP-N-acetylglucosamine--N-acetylmuramyl-(pentapeptide) pyrophosphoryl-undecaprenol N-acetylglucosamine transferase
MRVIFAGGGTGGHIYPALAVADELASRQTGFEALFVGTSRGIESSVVPESGYSLELISSRGVRGKGIGGKAVTALMLVKGIMQSMRIIRRFKPDLVFGSGGYASAATVSAAWLTGTGVVLQEQNSIPGLANRMLAPAAKRVYLGFAEASSYFKKDAPVVVTGNPLRVMIKRGRVGSEREGFGLSEQGHVMLVFGGSQGARKLSMAAAEYILERDDLQAIVQTGVRDFQEIQDMLACASDRVFVSPFIADIGRAYSAADFALARAGALSVSELAAAGLPSVLVPYPHCTDDHQRHNASVLVDAGGAVMIEDADLKLETLAAVLDPLLGDPALLERMRGSLEKYECSSATSMIADDMIGLAGGEAN